MYDAENEKKKTLNRIRTKEMIADSVFSELFFFENGNEMNRSQSTNRKSNDERTAKRNSAMNKCTVQQLYFDIQ